MNYILKFHPSLKRTIREVEITFETLKEVETQKEKKVILICIRDVNNNLVTFYPYNLLSMKEKI